MKYICCALALLLTLAVCCWVVILRISSLTEEIHLLLQEAGVALRLQQSERADEAIRQANALWQQNTGFWCSVLRHSDTEKIFDDLGRLQWEADAPIEKRLTLIAELCVQLRHLAEQEQALYFNFL